MGKLLDKWRNYNRDCVSPDSFINMSFYFIISASLQRRVHLGSRLNPLFPNVFTVFVAEPAVGKGRAIGPVIDILKYWKHDIKTVSGELRAHKEGKVSERQMLLETVVQTEEREHDPFLTALADMSEDSLPYAHKKEKPLAIPMGADTTTFQKLLQYLARNRRFTKFYEKTADGRVIAQTESTAPLAFCLDEMSSLFNKESDQIVQYLLKAYDCGDYFYDTKHQGEDLVKRCCVSILAGTNPKFMHRVLKSDLLNEGFASRTIFVYETANRFHKFLPDPYDEKQQQDRMDIVRHVGELLKLNGQVFLTPEAEEYTKYWYEKIHPFSRANTSIKLAHYYGRKNMHVAKMAMAIHFANSLEMTIEKHEVEEAIALLDDLEHRMHAAIDVDGANPLSALSKDIVKFLHSAGPQTFEDILVEFYTEGRTGEIQEVLEYLCRVKKVKLGTPKKVDGKVKQVYTL